MYQESQVIIGVPSSRDLNNMMHGKKLNYPVTAKDIEIIGNIFGPNIASLKVKIMVNFPLKFKIDCIQVTWQLIKINKQV